MGDDFGKWRGKIEWLEKDIETAQRNLSEARELLLKMKEAGRTPDTDINIGSKIKVRWIGGGALLFVADGQAMVPLAELAELSVKLRALIEASSGGTDALRAALASLGYE